MIRNNHNFVIINTIHTHLHGQEIWHELRPVQCESEDILGEGIGTNTLRICPLEPCLGPFLLLVLRGNVMVNEDRLVNAYDFK